MWYAAKFAGAGIALIAVIMLLALTANALLVALVWNWLGLHTVFHAATLGFWPIIGIALVLGLLGV